ncbi:hypothetical protein ACHQM5_030558 [Ranunculus cassubicifolius]
MAKPLSEAVGAFQAFGIQLRSQPQRVELAAFCQACSLATPVFDAIGTGILVFAKVDWIAKIDDLSKASESFSTLEAMVDQDFRLNTYRKMGSHSRNLLRVKRALELFSVFFEQILDTGGNSLQDPGFEAYKKVFATHHGPAIRNAVLGYMNELPTKTQFFENLNESYGSATRQLQNYIAAVAPINVYIEQLFESRDMGLEW